SLRILQHMMNLRSSEISIERNSYDAEPCTTQHKRYRLKPVASHDRNFLALFSAGVLQHSGSLSSKVPDFGIGITAIIDCQQRRLRMCLSLLLKQGGKSAMLQREVPQGCRRD